MSLINNIKWVTFLATNPGLSLDPSGAGERHTLKIRSAISYTYIHIYSQNVDMHVRVYVLYSSVLGA